MRIQKHPNTCCIHINSFIINFLCFCISNVTANINRDLESVCRHYPIDVNKQAHASRPFHRLKIINILFELGKLHASYISKIGYVCTM